MTGCDIAVVGTGPVGLAAALGLAGLGWDTCLVGPPPRAADGRTAALLGPSLDVLDRLGIWDGLAAGAGPLRILRIVDDTGSLFRPPPTEFRAAEIGLEAFGWNIDNARLTAALLAAADARPELRRVEALVEDAETGEAGVTLRLGDGRELRAALVVAADGRRSRVREAAGIRAREHRYPQAAFTTLLRHLRDHGDASTEFHRRGGPFTLVPLPGRRSSLVWVTRPAHARRLAALPDDLLAAAVSAQAGALLGEIAIEGPRGVTPLVAMSVDRYVGTRVALAGEAAHVLPPIGAQGLNLGFADVAALIDGPADRSGDPGDPERLAGYARARSADVRLRSAAVDGLNRSLLSEFPPLDAVRGLWLALLGQVGPLRRAAMRVGLPGRAGSSSGADAPRGRTSGTDRARI